MKWCGSLYLISVDIASKMYFVTFISGRSFDKLQKAMDDLVATFKIHGHDLKQVSCDRESAVSVMGAYLGMKGESLDLKASGQKCSRAEVAIRSLKDTARATFNSIQNEFGYLLPSGRLRQLLLLDSLKALNRRVRKNEVRSPYELFTGKKIDYARDFRAPFGAVVAVHRPRRGIGRDTSTISPKAELGIVVSRPMDGTSVIGVYLPSTKALVYSVKFERVSAPAWMLHELSSHVSADKITEQHSKKADFTPETAELQEGGISEAESDCAEGEQDDSTYVPSEDGEDGASDISLDEYFDIASGDAEMSDEEQPATLTSVGAGPLNYSEQQSEQTEQQQNEQAEQQSSRSSQQPLQLSDDTSPPTQGRVALNSM